MQQTPRSKNAAASARLDATRRKNSGATGAHSPAPPEAPRQDSPRTRVGRKAEGQAGTAHSGPGARRRPPISLESSPVKGGADGDSERRRVVTDPTARRLTAGATGSNLDPCSTVPPASTASVSQLPYRGFTPRASAQPFPASSPEPVSPGSNSGNDAFDLNPPSSLSTSSSTSSLALPPIPRSLSQSVAISQSGDGKSANGGAGDRLSVVRASMEGSNDGRVSLDSYYTRSSPMRETPASTSSNLFPMQTPQGKPSAQHLRSPSTPGPIDPHVLDRRGLIGVGELSTPRWFNAATGAAGEIPGWSSHYRRAQSISQAMVPSESYESFTGLGAPGAGKPSSSTTPLGGARLVSGPRPRVPSGPRNPSEPPRPPSDGDRVAERMNKAQSQESEAPTLPRLPSMGEFSPFKSEGTSTRNELDTPFSSPSASSNRSRSRTTSTSNFTSSRRYSPRVQADLSALKGTEAARQVQGPTLEQQQPLDQWTSHRWQGDRSGINKESSTARAREQSGASDDRGTDGTLRNGRLSRTSEMDLRKTPPSASRRERASGSAGSSIPNSPHNQADLPSAQSIIRHFGSTRDFSHLPPSPSTASINKFMLKESASVPVMSSQESVAQDSPHSGPGISFPQQGPPATASMATPRYRSTYSTLDRDTAEAIRKLDGLGKTQLKQRSEDDAGRRIRKAASTNSVGRDTDRHGEMLPPPVPSSQSQGQRRSSMQRPPPRAWDGCDDEDIRGATIQKRGSSSSTSGGTSFSAASGASTAPSSAYPSSAGIPANKSTNGSAHDRRTSAGSDLVGSDGGGSDSDFIANVPPVPPLPKDFQSMRPGQVPRSYSSAHMSLPKAAEYVPIKDEKSLPQLTISAGRLPNSISSPVIGSDDYQGSPLMPSPSSPLSTSAETPSLGSQRPRRMSKKWSFSALGFNNFGMKDRADAPSVTAPTPTSPLASVDDTSSTFVAAMTPQSASWSSRNDTPASAALLPQPSGQSQMGDGRKSSSASSIGTANARRHAAKAEPTPAPPPTKKLSQSSIPFFRRTSSSSISTTGTSKPTVSQDQRDSAPPTRIPASSLTSRKSVLGIGIPSLLKGSSSKRNLAVARENAVEEAQRQQVDLPSSERKSSLGWSGRRRGKTLSNALDSPPLTSKALPPMQIKELAPTTVERVDSLKRKSLAGGGPSRIRTSSSSNVLSDAQADSRPGSGLVRSVTQTALQTSKTNLSTIAGSPSVISQNRNVGASASIGPSSSLRGMVSATPTKIPRMTSRSKMSSPNVASTSFGSMGPPSLPNGSSNNRVSVPVVTSARIDSMVTARDRRTIAEVKPTVNEFGVISLADVPRQFQGSRRSSRDATADMPRAEDSPSVIGDTLPATGMRKVSAPATSGVRRALPVPPTTSVVASASATPKTDRMQRELPLPPNSRRVSLNAQHNAEPPASASKLSAVQRLALPSSSRMSQSNSTPMLASPRPSSIRQSISSRSQSPAMEEDQVAGDDEMAVFYKRQRAKRTVKDTAADEIDHLLRFPEAGEPLAEMTPHAYVQANFAHLSLYERREIVEFQSIYYSGTKSNKNAATPESTQNNYGYDDERGDYLVIPGDHLAYRYEIEGILGKGSFGQVLQCRDHKTGQYVAIKIIRNKKRFHHQAQVEVKILENLVSWDPRDKHHMIRVLEHFHFRSHLCIVTELLSINLYEMIKANSFVGFSTTLIRRFTHQLLASLQLMREKKIIHCDLKPENILLCHPGKSRIKVIDFGSSCFEHEKVYTYIQSRFYRSPEIILGCNYHMAIDMWSLGCILAELYTGFPIFPGENEQEQLSCIMEVLGVPDRGFVQRSSRYKLFFDSTGNPRPFVNSKGKRRRPGAKSLPQVLKCEDDQFVDFISKCLIWDPERRLKPNAAMSHPWITSGRRSRLVSPAPGSVSSRLSSGAVNSPSASRTRSIHQDALKDRIISGPSPLVARRTVQGTTLTSTSNGSTEPGTKPRHGQYNVSRGIAA